MPEQAMDSANDFSAAPISLYRRSGTDMFATLAAVAAVGHRAGAAGSRVRISGLQGIGSFNWAFLTQTPKPVGEAGGGMANAIAGSVLILLIGSVFGVPLGIGAGIYLAEYGRGTASAM